MPSRFTPIPDAWDIVIADDADDTNPLTLMLVADDEVAMWEGVDAPSLSTDEAVYREIAVMWQPQAGAGYSRRTQETTSTGPDGQLVSVGTSYGRNATFVVPGIVMPAGKLTEITLPVGLTGISGRIIDGEEYGPYPVVGTDKDLHLTTRGRYLLTIAAGTDTPSLRDIGASYTTDSLQTFDGKLYLSGGGSGVVQELDETVWTACAANCEATDMARVNWMPSNAIMGGTGGGTPADHLILVDEAGDGYWHVVSGNDVKVFSNWIGGATSVPIGDTTYKIKSIASAPTWIAFAKQNGLHGLTEVGRVVNFTPWVESTFHPNNGDVSAFYSDDHQAFVFYGHQQGLVAIAANGTQQSTARFVQFGARQPNETTIWGRPRAIAPYVDGVFVAYYDGTDSYVMRLIIEKDGSYRWSGSERTILGQEITWMRVTSRDGVPRLWIATVSDPGGVVHLYWQALPSSGNPWVDYQAGLGHPFETDWDVSLPRDDAGSSAEKVVRRYDIVARGVGDGNIVMVDASADDADYVEQGWISEGARTSFVATTYQVGTQFNWRLRVQNSESVPIVLETFQARMSVLPEQSDVWTFRCQLASGQGIANDAEDTQDPYTVRSRVRAFQRAGPIQMRRSPLSRETLVIKMEQGSRLQSIKTRKTGELVVVLTFTISVLLAGAVYDAGDAFNAAEYGSDDS